MQVRTYDVVPISSSLGIVEFVPGTQPLKESICTFLSEEVSAPPVLSINTCSFLMQHIN